MATGDCSGELLQQLREIERPQRRAFTGLQQLTAHKIILNLFPNLTLIVGALGYRAEPIGLSLTCLGFSGPGCLSSRSVRLLRPPMAYGGDPCSDLRCLSWVFFSA